MPLYLHFIRQYAGWLILSILLGTLLGVLGMQAQPQRFDVSLELDLERTRQPSDEYYQYDGFYAIRATDKFAKVVKGWFQTPSFVISILEQSGTSTETIEVPELRNTFTSEKISSNTVEVRWQSPSRQKAQARIAAIDNVVQEKLNVQDTDRSQFTIKTSTPVVKRHEYNALFFGIAGAALGAFLGLVGSLIYEIRNRKI